MKKIIFLIAILVASGLSSSRAQNVNNALDFDGVNDYVSLPALNLNSNTVTLEAWIKPDATQNGASGIVFCRASNSIAGFSFSNNDPTRIGYHWNNNPSTFEWTGGPVYTPNVWQHVALVIEPTKGTIYLNGIPYVNNVVNSIEEFDGETRIGQDNCCGSRYSNGNIDEVRIWNVARTQSEIKANMSTSLTGNETGLVAYYRFNQGIAGGNNAGVTTLNDITANNNDGQLINFALTGNTSNWVAGMSPLENTSYGTNALSSNSSGLYNSAFGYYSLNKNTTGNNNSAFGYNALYANKGGSSNMAFGSQALYTNTIGNENTALGTFALLKNKSGTQNTATGTNALYANTTGNYNTATGVAALTSNTTGISNTASGFSSLSSNTTGNANTATGYFALIANTTGLGNTGTGWSALSNNTTGKFNTALGNNANIAVGNLTNSTALGRGSLITASNQVRIGNSSVTSIGGYTGWSNISDGRYKQNLKEDVPGLKFINALRPVTYNLKITELDGFLRKDIRKTGKNGAALSEETELDKKAAAEKEKIIYTGFIAQEVERAARAINYDFSGVDAPKNDHDVYALRYAEFVVPLVKAVQELSQENDQLKNEIDALKKTLRQIRNDAAMSYSSQTNCDEKLSIAVSRNPVRSVLNESIKDNCISPVITAPDMYGLVILVKRVTQSQTERDLGKLTAGAYITKITNTDNRQLYSAKFIKQN